jgi:predicted GH43/DUF377 family glycosyl hydrolase
MKFSPVFIGLFVLFVLLLFSTCKDSTQPDTDNSNNNLENKWTKHPDPILKPGPEGSWEDEEVGNPSVLFDGSIYHMWYLGYDGEISCIGYATSQDGISWNKHSTPVLEPGPTGSWDNPWVYRQCVLLNNNTFHMWYSGYDGQTGCIGYATSTNGIDWTKHESNLVIEKGAPDSWSQNGVDGPSVTFDGSIYHMWFNGWYGPNYFHIGYATSPDGLNWTEYESNPVLDVGSTGSWDYPRVEEPSVLYIDGNFHMWYSGGSSLWNWEIGYATSIDGIDWTKVSSDKPVLESGTSGDWDDFFVYSSSVLLDTTNSTLKMWYVGGKEAWAGRIGYATSPYLNPN